MKTETVAEGMRQATPSRGRWTLPVNLFKPSRAPALRPAIQGELSLDKVKPVRNDLSDSDLDLVAATKKPEATPDAVKIECVEVLVVKARTIFERVRGLFERTK
jgi:hypothetical protein